MRKLLLLSFLISLVIVIKLIYQNKNSKPVVDKTSLEYMKQDPQLLKVYNLRQKKLNPHVKPTDRPDAAMQYEAALRSEIGKPFSYSKNWRMDALNKANQLPLQKNSADNMVWVERGPGNIGGRSRAIVIHPEDVNTWWVGSVGGGIWQTKDAGESWICQTDDLPVLSTTTIDICKSNPEILYAGTGEGFYNYDAVIGDGIFKTENGGLNWQHLESTIENVKFRYVNRIIVHPNNSDTLIAATNQGLYRSFDGGDSWTTIFEDSGRVQQIIANPINFSTQFLTINGRGIYKSTDMGSTWHNVSEEITNHERIEIAIAPADTNFLYAAAELGGSLSGFYKSSDSGENWLDLGNEPNWFRNQGWYDNTLCVDPFNQHTVIVGGIDLLKINTALDTMVATALSNWYGGQGLDYVHADQHFIVSINGTGNNYSIVVANDGGVYFSPDKGANWENKNNNFNVTQYYDGDRHPFQDRFIAGSQDNGTNLSPSGTIYSDSWSEPIGGDGFDCAWDKENPKIIYGTLYDSHVYKSTNGGGSFTLLTGGDLPESDFFHTPLEMDPHNSQKLFTASESNTIYFTENGGENWSAVPVELGGSKLIKIRVSKADSNIVWAASESGYINYSTDGGSTFTKIDPPAGTPYARLSGMETHPHDFASALIMFGIYGYGKIYRTEDLGSSWDDITNNLPDVPVHCAIIMPYNTDEIWIGTDIGVFISTNNGQSWSYSDNGLPAVSVRRLKIVDQEIIAVTHGRGIWSMHNNQLPDMVIPLAAPILEDLDYPDPNLNQLKINFMARGDYDSLLIKLNGETVRMLTTFPIYEDSFSYIPVEAPNKIDIQIAGIKNRSAYLSESKTVNYFEKVDTLNEDFEETPTAFAGDFKISLESGFNSAALHTEHFYHDQREYKAVIETPIKIYDDSKLTYRDVAIVEPGEDGVYYPDFQMWDYVTVEGSINGVDWDILITPYDCRYNNNWKNAYDNSLPGTSEMFIDHEIDLAETYTEGQLVYLRFRLFADPATTGWGWVVDDVKVSSEHAVSFQDYPHPVNEFKLIGNYPNPFNYGTTIQFTLEDGGPIKLNVFDVLGQKIKTLINNKEYSADSIHRIQWNGTTQAGTTAASGTYYYQLISNGKSQVKKMVLLR